jgi:hypothetical protein
MRQPRLIERLNSRSEDAPVALRTVPGQTETLVLTGVARALQAATRQLKPAPRFEPVPARAPIILDVAPAAVEAVPHDSEGLPLVLMGRGPQDPAQRSANPPEPRSVNQYTAPLLLGLAIIAIGLLMTAPVPDIASGLGLEWFAAKPRPKLARLSPAETPVLTQALLYHPADDLPRITSLDDQVLLERCEAMIARGEVREAREQLAKAAADGRQIARFALAETFDPNVLAAWGLRENVADANVAKTLYRQALEAGDHRAVMRIDALSGGSQ